MPGWLSPHGGQGEQGGATPADTAAPEAVPSSAHTQSRALTRAAAQSLTQSQRDELLAEVLGDVGLLLDKVREVSVQMQQLESALTVQDLVRWRNTLDAKFTELGDVNLSEQAAQRLQTFAAAYMDQMARQLETMATLQVKKSVSDTLAFHTLFDKLQRDWLVRLASIVGASFAGTALALILGALL